MTDEHMDISENHDHLICLLIITILLVYAVSATIGLHVHYVVNQHSLGVLTNRPPGYCCYVQMLVVMATFSTNSAGQNVVYMIHIHPASGF